MRIGILTEKNDIIDGEIRFKVVPQRFLRIAVIRQHGKAVTLPYPFGCRSVVELHVITSNNVGVF